MNETKKGKGLVGRIIGIAIAIIVPALVANFVPPLIENYQIKKEVENFNATLPKQLDELSRIDSVKMISAKSINYFISVDILKEETNDSILAENIDINVLNSIKTEASLENFRKKNFTWKYTYTDKEGVLFHEYTVTPEMYK